MTIRRLQFVTLAVVFAIVAMPTCTAFAQQPTEKAGCEQPPPIRKTSTAPIPKTNAVVNHDVQVFCGSKEIVALPPQEKASESRKASEDAGFDYAKLIDAISKLLASIAWPIAAVLIAYFFRAELRQLFGRLESLKYKDAEAKFNKELKEAESAAAPVREKIPDGWEKATARSMFTQYEQFRRIAELSPRAAILEAWIDVEVAIYAAAEKAGLEVKGPANAYSLARNLVSLGKVPQDILPFFEKLRRLRNNAAHLPDFVLDESEANKYLDLALGLANTFREYAVEGDDHPFNPPDAAR